MQIKDLLNKQVVWLSDKEEESDIIISSRIRLARNLTSFPFKNWITSKKEQELLKKLKEILEKSKYLKKSVCFDLDLLKDIERYFLVERHLISKEHAEYNGRRSVFISDNETLSIMVNEEDHLRMQALLPGMQLIEAYRVLEQFDAELQQYSEFAFLPEWGYLTACPTNVGTGMRASVMLHLPCLVLTKQINKVLEAVSKLGLTVRGLYGEGTAAVGDFFQISNQITLGLAEEEIIDNLEKVCRQIVMHEKNARKHLYSKETLKLEDRICRAYGILQHAHVMSYNEAIDLLSAIRLGINLNVLDRKLKTVVDELFVLTQPAHLQLIEDKKLTPVDRDKKRAELIREKLK